MNNLFNHMKEKEDRLMKNDDQKSVY
jgi:hypothetical protein